MTTNTTPLVADPGRITALARDIAEGRLSPVALMERCLARVQAVEPVIQCWRQLDGGRALDEARLRESEARAGRLRGPLHGLPFAVKDIIDVAGLPTRCNSRSREHAPPATADAEIVLALRRQGAIPLGKVHTTEFAYFDPSPARNPHNPAHTPGGSSSGSGAAVAAGMVPFALGTQTVASLNRPAAYCGIAAFKPSTRAIPTFGVGALAASYDTVGFYGGTVADAVAVFEAIAPAFLPPVTIEPGRLLTVVVPEDAHLADASVEVQAMLARVGRTFAGAGHKVIGRVSPISFGRLFTLQRQTMLYEAGRTLRHLTAEPAGLVGERILAAIAEGLAIDTTTYLDMRGEIDAMRETFFTFVADADACLWPATPGPAPEGLASTGDPRYIAPWTALGGPIITVPSGRSGNGLPLGCLLAGRPGSDRSLGRAAVQLAETLAGPIGA